MKPPTFKPGDIIASTLACGVIESSFLYKGEWNYILRGLSAIDVQEPLPDREGGFKLGNRYIRDREVTWVYINSNWLKTSDKLFTPIKEFGEE